MQVIGFVGAQGSTSWNWPAGTAVGDVALLVGVGNSNVQATGFTALGAGESGFDTGYEIDSGGSRISAAFKVITSGDLSNAGIQGGVEPSFGWMHLVTIRDAEYAQFAGVSPKTLTASSDIPGFTKSPSSVGYIIFSADRDNSPVSSMPAPTGFVSVTTLQGTYFASRVSKMENAAGYTSGTPISVPVIAASYYGRGLIIEMLGDAPPEPLDLEAEFVGTKGELNATLDNPLALSAEFIGQAGALSALAVNAIDDEPIQVALQLGGSEVVVISEWLQFQNVAPTHKSIRANFTGKPGMLAADLLYYPDIEADFVGKKGILDALLGRGQFGWAVFTGQKGELNVELLKSPMIEAGFVGNPGVLGAELVLEGLITAEFIGKAGSITSYYPGFIGQSGYLSTYYPGLMGKPGHMDALLLGGDAAYVAFMGKNGALNAELTLAPLIEAGFVGKPGLFEAEIENNYFVLEASFVGQPGALSAILDNNQIAGDFVGKPGYLTGLLEGATAISAEFVGKSGKLDAYLLRGLGIDAFFRGKKGYLEAEIDFAPVIADINYTYGRFQMEITGTERYNSGMTFILIQP
jgi:hypothetical protein